ncbi:MAG: response regulator [Bacteroidetes bacterium]|nr:MAG: response regulator [Bacteroidota bacterium]
MDDNPLTVLLVEDDPAHAELLVRSFRRQRLEGRIVHVEDGEAALEYLFREGRYADANDGMPSLIVLDLRLPRVDGLEVLRQIKTTPALARIPVVILTTSTAEQDVSRAYALHANSYLVKPVDFGQYRALVGTMGVYWLECNYFSHDV